MRQGDPSFMFQDGLTLVPRAMLEITSDCPTQIRNHIVWAFDKGYLKCMANVYTVEHLRDVLAGD